VPASCCSMFFCVRTEDLFVGVRSFKSRVFCASGMENTWQLLPPSPMEVTPSSGLQAEAVVMDGETCLRWRFVANLSILDPGGVAASSNPPSGFGVAPPATGACGLCRKALMIFEQGWDGGICNRCYNKRKGKPTCQGPCGNGLWNPEAAAGFDKCCVCQRYECKYCGRHLTVQEVRYAKVCCNACYNSKEKKSTDPCRECQKLLPAQAKSAWCDECWQRWCPEGGR